MPSRTRVGLSVRFNFVTYSLRSFPPVSPLLWYMNATLSVCVGVRFYYLLDIEHVNSCRGYMPGRKMPPRLRSGSAILHEKILLI